MDDLEDKAAAFAMNMQESINKHLGHEVIPAWGPIAAAYKAGYAVAKAENARLREALENIMRSNYGGYAEDIAREALKGGE